MLGLAGVPEASLAPPALSSSQPCVSLEPEEPKLFSSSLLTLPLWKLRPRRREWLAQVWQGVGGPMGWGSRALESELQLCLCPGPFLPLWSSGLPGCAGRAGGLSTCCGLLRACWIFPVSPPAPTRHWLHGFQMG